jgi:hypothetical protein
MLLNAKEAAARIASGKRLIIAGEKKLLESLPKGEWIGGSIPYFMDDSGGKTSRELIYANEIPAAVSAAKISSYGVADLKKIPVDSPENGFTYLILPATSPVHLEYAQNAPAYPGLFLKPIFGWISGVHLDDLGKIKPCVFDGKTGKCSDSDAIAMHCSLPAGKMAQIGIVNLFKPGAGDSIRFEKTGFTVAEALVNGKEVNFAEYVRSNKIDTKLPLVADYAGAMVNVSFQAVNAATVDLYAPVFVGVEYKIAGPVGDYVKEFNAAIPAKVSAELSCNCILNFLYSELEGKRTPGIQGPITFGEIAYQLLNQTLVYLTIT